MIDLVYKIKDDLQGIRFFLDEKKSGTTAFSIFKAKITNYYIFEYHSVKLFEYYNNKYYFYSDENFYYFMRNNQQFKCNQSIEQCKEQLLKMFNEYLIIEQNQIFK